MKNNIEKNRTTGIKSWPEDDRPREKLPKNVIKYCVPGICLMIDELEKQVAERKNQAEMLMQSVLREAFEN